MSSWTYLQWKQPHPFVFEFIPQFVVLKVQVVLSCTMGISLPSLFHSTALFRNRTQKALKRKSLLFLPHLISGKKIGGYRKQQGAPIPTHPRYSDISQLPPLGNPNARAVFLQDLSGGGCQQLPMCVVH